MYEVVLVNPAGELTIVEGNGQFGTSRQENFHVPRLSNEMVALARSAKIQSKKVATVAGPTTEFKIYIDFSDYHEDTSWKVTSLDGTQTFAFEDVGHYRYGADVTETIKLAPGSYKFIIQDRHGTNSFRAFNSYKGYFMDGSETTVAFESEQWLNGDEFVHEFVVPESAVSGPYSVSPSDIFDDRHVDIEEAVLEEEAAFEEATMEETTIEQATLEMVTARTGPECELRKLHHRCTANEQCCSGFCSRFRCTSQTLGETQTARSGVDYSMRGSINDSAGGADRGSPP